jgi:CheY-like chemotaxis protein
MKNMTARADDNQPLQGMRILVADDEFLIAAVLEDTLSEAGAEIVSAATVGEALKSAETASLSAAVLDVRLGRQTTEPVADALTSRKVPFLFYSGQALPDHMRDKYPKARILMKPTPHNSFVEAILNVVD